MRKLILLFLSCILVACSSAASIPTATQAAPTDTLSAFSSTKLYQLTAEIETNIAEQPKNDATITAIMAGKYAGGTAMAETMTAMPTLTLTPTIPPDSPTCRAQDLLGAYSGAQGATQSIVGGVNLTNISALPCFLQVWPQAVLVDQLGHPLDVQYSYTSPYDLPFDKNAMLGLPPGRTAWFSLQWGNWCLPAVNAGVSVRLTLAQNGGTLTTPTDLTGGGVCNDPGNKSWVGIFPFSMP
jgi:hypothetical protein